MIKKHKVAILLLLLAGIIGGCGNEEKKIVDRGKAKGDVFFGGVFRINEIEDFRNLFPLSITEVTSHHITNQIYEGLVKLSQKDLTILPGIAEKWEINDSATVFTFHIRKGVNFQDDPCFKDGKGREVTANDFKYCLDKLCEASSQNQGFWVFKNRVVGADEYYRSTLNKKPLTKGVAGVKVIDDYSLQIELKYSFAGFLNILTMPFTWVYPKEAFEKYGQDMRIKCVGTGPFRVKEIKEGQAVILVRNENYWGVDEYGNQLPYLEVINFSFIKEKKSELLEFRKKNLDMVFQLPSEMFDEVLSNLDEAGTNNPGFQLQTTPAMSTQYYGFLHTNNLFKDKLVRQAINYAIDRRKIVNFTLKGEGLPAINGFVPPSFTGYDTKAVKGYEYNPEKARKLLAQAGYPNGKGLPQITLQLNSGGTKNTQIAQVVQNMLKETLNIDVNMDVLPLPQHIENFEMGKTPFWRIAWIADYPDPENFLNVLYGKNVPDNPKEKAYMNPMRYKSATFDSLFEAARKELDFQKRNELYRKADQTAMDDASIMPLLYDENYRLLQSNVRNFDANPMEYRDMSRIYLIPNDKMPKKNNEEEGLSYER